MYSSKTRLFDARPDRLDFRDLAYVPPLRSLPPVHPQEADVAKYLPGYVKAGLVLDQGSEGACTGFGLACVANYLLWTRHVQSGTDQPFASVSPRMFYELAKRYDEWPGDDYDGSSCRGALKGWQKHGVCSASNWPYAIDPQGKAKFVHPRDPWQADAATRPLGVYYRVDAASIVALQAAIADIGAVYVSADVHDGWDALSARGKAVLPSSHAALPIIGPAKDPRNVGGHAFALVGFNERGFVVQNSWGTAWGASGFGVLPYDDWLAHGTDAWACALGVRVDRSASSPAAMASRWRVGRGKTLTELRAGAGPHRRSGPIDDPWPVSHEYHCKAYEPWSTHEAYSHLLLVGHGGDLVQTDFTRAADDRAGLAHELVVQRAGAFFAKLKGRTAKLAIVAGSGLQGEEEAIEQTRLLGPCFEANRIYPLYLGSRTAFGDVLGEAAGEWSRSLSNKGETASQEARTRAIEAMAHLKGRGLWSDRKAAAERACLKGGALDLLLRQLLALQKLLAADGKRLELHVVGHSLGALLIGHLLSALGAAAPRRRKLAVRLLVKTCTLMAPACSVRFGADHILGAAKAHVLSLKQLVIYTLSDASEKRDQMAAPRSASLRTDPARACRPLRNGPAPARVASQGDAAYDKSLLILLSRAMEDKRKMPMLGLERAHLGEYAHDFDQWAAGELATVQAWQKAFGGRASARADGRLGVFTRPRIRTSIDDGSVPATHGNIARSIDAWQVTLERIRGGSLVGPVECLGG